MKHIVLLGGSKLQLDLILEVKRMNFIIHLFDANENCFAKSYADNFYAIDFVDKKLVLKIAKEIQPIAILSIATEIGNLTACFVSEELGLLSNSYNTAKNTTNKILMKEICNQNNIKTASYEVITSNTDTSTSFMSLTLPYIVKPIDSSAGRGVSYIENKNEIQTAIYKASTFSSSNQVLVEEYIEGKQYSIETITSKDDHQIVSITEEYITKPPIIIETQQLLPARINIAKQKRIEEFTLKILESFDISYGASHLEIRENSSGELYFIELASRMGGWRSELISLSLGINYCQLLIFSSLGKEVEFTASRNDIAIVKMILNEENFEEYKKINKEHKERVISDLSITKLHKAKHLADSNGYYFIHVQNTDNLNDFIGEHV